MYNTGDIGLWNPDGSIKIHGRCDDQIKIKVSNLENNKLENFEKKKRFNIAGRVSGLS